jgi:predicted Zn-dependent peptidase
MSVSLYFAAGSRHETKNTAGVAHFVEHMLFKGTERRPTAMDISASIEGLGGILNAETGKEVTIYWAKVSRPHFKKALDVLADIVLCSRLEQEEVEKERKVIIEELNMMMDLPQDWVDVLIDQVLWGDQPLGWDVGGTKISVGGMNRGQLLGFIASRYAPNNAVVSVAGAASHAEIVNEVQQLLGNWQAKAVAPFTITGGPQDNTFLAVENRATEQARHRCPTSTPTGLSSTWRT